MRLMKTRSMLKNRRGVSAVISNLILIGAVIAVGFAVLAWSQYQSSSYNSLYGERIKADTDQLRERVAFEYIHYDADAGNVTVFLINSGTIGDVAIANVYVDSPPPYATPTLFLLSGAEVGSLDTTQEGYFSIHLSSILEEGKNYPITIVTGRGSSFVATFAT